MAAFPASGGCVQPVCFPPGGASPWQGLGGVQAGLRPHRHPGQLDLFCGDPLCATTCWRATVPSPPASQLNRAETSSDVSPGENKVPTAHKWWDKNSIASKRAICNARFAMCIMRFAMCNICKRSMMINTKVGGATGLLEGSDEDCLQVNEIEPPLHNQLSLKNEQTSSQYPQFLILSQRPTVECVRA